MPARDVLTLCDDAQAWHVTARATLARLDDRVRSGTADPRLIAPWTHFTRGIRAHLAEEELVLFPALRELAQGKAPPTESWRGMLDDMERELSEMETLSAALRSAARDAGPLEAELLDLLDDLEVHARVEEQELLPAARRMLSAWEAGPPSPRASQAPPEPPPPLRKEGSVLRRTARRILELVAR
ncbi:hemerythrin domain-containing protein [Myxococcota bacterium]|nr:hemerythrin domain-containing protein [Myxococcota bacterium]